MKKIQIVFVIALVCNINYVSAQSQDFREQYEQFKKQTIQEYSSFRDECNQKYADFLRTAWDWYEEKTPLPIPNEDNPIPPKPYKPIDEDPITVVPSPVNPIKTNPQPKPISPIEEKSNPVENWFSFGFYGVNCKIRLPEEAKILLNDCSSNTLGDVWEHLSNEKMNNSIRDCLETRLRYNLSDWAYLQFLTELATQFCGDKNGATFLAAFLYCQSGYQMRMGEDNGRLVMLIGSNHYIYEWPYYIIDGTFFYPIGNVSNKLRICNADFEGETPMSLNINAEQILGSELSEDRTIMSKGFPDVVAASNVPLELIKFYDTYPASAADNNPLTRWAMYANTPLANRSKEAIYPSLKKSIEKYSKLEAANKLLNWVQTGFVYEYDDKVWGHDRAFFAEETLYYPFADCEDRSILFSRLVRDLLDLDVALVYYPGHLATAVKFDTEVRGDAMLINGERYVVCDPTYIGAPIGVQMPDLKFDKAEAIVLTR